MFESIAAGLVLAALSALVFLAYHHPAQFHRITRPLLWAATAILGGVQFWSIAIERARSAIVDTVDYAKFADIDKALAPLAVSPLVFAIGTPAIILFMAVLSVWVANLKYGEKNDESDHEEP